MRARGRGGGVIPVLNDFGEAAYQRVTQQAHALAGKLGIQPEIIVQFFNETAHFPQTLDELNRWGDTPDKEYGFRRRQPNGVWTPIMQGVTPGKAENDPGFKHRITNEVGNIQRFQQVDPSGNVFGGSWDPAANAAHPEWAGQPATAGLGQDPRGGGVARLMSGSFGDPQNYTGQEADGWWAVVGGRRIGPFPSKEQAEGAYNANGGPAPGGSTAPGGAPPAAGSVGAPGPGSAGPGATPGAGTPGAGTPTSALTNPDQNSVWLRLFQEAASNAIAKMRIDLVEIPAMKNLDEREKQRILLEAGRDAWQKAYQEAQLSGTYNGQPILEAAKALGVIGGQDTLDKTKLGAELTGFTGPGYAGQAAAAYERLPPEQRTPEMAATIWRNVVPGLSAQEGAAMDDAGHSYYAATGQTMPDAVAAQHLARITGGRISGTGAQATPAFQHQQNQDALSALTLLSNLRGPENAFAYADTLANMPDSIKQTIGAAMNRLPMTPRNPAATGVLGDVGVGQPGGGTVQGGPAMVAQPGLIPTPGGDDRPINWTGGPNTLPGAPGLGPGPMTTAPLQPEGVNTMPTAVGGAVAQRGLLEGAAAGQPGYAAAPGAAGGGMVQGGPAMVGPTLGPDYRGAAGPAAGMGGVTQMPTYGPRTQPAGGFEMLQGGPMMRTQSVAQRGLIPGVGPTPVPGGVPAAPPKITPGVGIGPLLPGQQPGQPPPAFGPRTQPMVRPMPLASQISPTDYGKTNVYGQKLMWAGYEHEGQDKEAVMDTYRKSLPKAYGPRTGRRRAA